MISKGIHSFEGLYDGLCTFNYGISTNGPQGGDAGHGAFLEISFRNDASTALSAEIDGQVKQIADSVKLRFEGDAEIEGAAEALFAFAEFIQKLRSVSL